MQTSLNKNSNFFDRVLETAEKSGISGVPALAKALGYSSPEKLYRLQRDPDTKPSYDIIVDLSNLFEGVDMKWLLTGVISKTNYDVVSYESRANLDEVEKMVSNSMKIADHIDKLRAPTQTVDLKFNDDYLKGKVIRPITVTVDRSGKELITYVPVKAQAGYARGYGDDKFMSKLPAFTLPNFNENGSFRMFQVQGDSMRQLGGGGLQDGDIVIGQYVEDFFTIKDNMVYVVVSTDGIVIKRLINRLSTADKMVVLKSDNKNGDYPNKLLPAGDIVEVWEYKAHISRQLNFATDLWDLINELQVQNAKLSERVDDIDSKTRAIINRK